MNQIKTRMFNKLLKNNNKQENLNGLILNPKDSFKEVRYY
jgi:hypothetical protein